VFSTVLIANRGEIALRVARTCRELGIRTVAVYSTADRDTAVTRFADACVQIGAAPARRSYLNVAAIIEAARQVGADAIHPGYGFLSEDPVFAEVCEAHGLTLVGPGADVLELLGDKASAREAAARAGIPVLPGSTRSLDTAHEAKAVADDIGYPVLLKAVAGGGGRGISRVVDPQYFQPVYEEARAVALATFGDARLYVEKYLDTARHVEVQVLADRYGRIMHLGARDCSVQRRRQKLVEETPPPGLAPELVEEICTAAVRGARHAGYVGAGTLEFLVDQDGRYYFIEANCRIQVEHPVTELVTGLDLVREQLRVAAGERLDDQVTSGLRGAALECRVNAEDPERGFLPTPGTLEEYLPPGGPFVRVDSHCHPGMVLSPDYDPLLAKVVVWGPDRSQAIARMDRALGEFRIGGRGMSTTIDFLRDILSHPLFLDGKHTTSLVDDMRNAQPPS
jgi:acetyl-CoA carboxylase, biotin carboxylase subunit